MADNDIVTRKRIDYKGVDCSYGTLKERDQHTNNFSAKE